MKIGFANGCFDLFHEGHRHFLTQCRLYCEYLIVAVNTDGYCKRVKGADRPFDPLRTRMLHVRAYSEAVIPFDGQEDPLILEIGPDVIFRGPGQNVPSRGPYTIMVIGRLPGFSTTLAAAAQEGKSNG